jgi:hypothetical protein
LVPVAPGNDPLLSAAKLCIAVPKPLRLETDFAKLAERLEELNAGTAKPASTAKIAITTSSSTSVKAGGLDKGQRGPISKTVA